ncbi:hypothetical protein WJX77_009000 [Trebouxia sp. C0004]
MLALQAGAGNDTEADAFFLESSDSDSALETSSIHMLVSDEGAQQSVSHTYVADPVSPAQAQIAAREQAQPQRAKRQSVASCGPDSSVPSKKPRRSNVLVRPVVLLTIIHSRNNSPLSISRQAPEASTTFAKWQIGPVC